MPDNVPNTTVFTIINLMLLFCINPYNFNALVSWKLLIFLLLNDNTKERIKHSYLYNAYSIQEKAQQLSCMCVNELDLKQN